MQNNINAFFCGLQLLGLQLLGPFIRNKISRDGSLYFLNVSDMRTGLDLKSAQFDSPRTRPRTGSNCADLKSSPV